MYSNPRWYPTELPELAESSSSSGAVESAISELRIGNRQQAIRQSLARRSAGILSASQQNSGVIIVRDLMPLTIDPILRSQPPTQTVVVDGVATVAVNPSSGNDGVSVGSKGFVCGGESGDSIDKIIFSTDTFSTIAAGTLLGNVKGRASASSITSGLIAGGANRSTLYGVGGGAIEKFDYASETSSNLPVKLSYANVPTWYNVPQGFSSRVFAYFTSLGSYHTDRVSFEARTLTRLPMPGLVTHHGTISSTRSHGYYFGDRARRSGGVWDIAFSTESATYNGGAQDTSGESRQSLGSGSGSIYVFGGRSQDPTFNYKYSVSSRHFSKISADLSAPVVNAASVGNSVAGYLCGGTNGPWHYNNSFFTSQGRTEVMKFDYSTETLTANSSALPTARSHPAGISDYSGAFYG